MADNPDNLTSRQQKAIIALTTGQSVETAAESVGIGARTLHRWRTQPGFREALRQSQQEVFSDALAELQSRAADAVSRLISMQTDEEASPSVRLGAITSHLSLAVRHYENCELLTRIEQLESRL